MVALSKTLSSYLCKNYFILDDRCDFDEDELYKIRKISASKNELLELKYFPNLEYLDLDLFPSVNEDDLRLINEICPNIKGLKIEEQNNIYNLDVSYFNNLRELVVIHNDNLLNIVGVRSLDKLCLYDNKEYNNKNQITDFLVRNTNCKLELDIYYYVYIVRRLNLLRIDVSLVDSVEWIESLGLRDFKITRYTRNEVKELFTNLTDIVSKYTYVTDGDAEKYGVLYQWMLDNIKFINEDDPKGENVENFNNVGKVFAYKRAGRLTYAKAFQLLLSVAGIDTKIVYSMGANESIGYYDGIKVYSLLGNTDYALLRVYLNDRIYYSDIAWDSMVNTLLFADSLRMFLVSKDELKIRHNFVGEGNIEKSYSYRNSDIEDLLMYASDRLKEVDILFRKFDDNMSAIIGAQINISFTNKTINEMKDMLKKYVVGSEEYQDISFSIEQQEELLKDYLAEEENLIKQRKDMAYMHRKELANHYIGDKIDLNNRLVIYRISNYIYELVKAI